MLHCLIVELTVNFIRYDKLPLNSKKNNLCHLFSFCNSQIFRRDLSIFPCTNNRVKFNLYTDSVNPRAIWHVIWFSLI